MEIEFQLTEKDYERFYWLLFKRKARKRVKKDETLKWKWKNITAIRSNTEFLWLILDNKKYYLIPQRAKAKLRKLD